MSPNHRNMREEYNNWLKKYDLKQPLEAGKINHIIRQSLQQFLKCFKRPAIYCNGGHTRCSPLFR